MSGLIFKIASSPKELEEVFKMRHSIFILEQGIPAELDRDGKDDDSIHLLAYSNHEAVASGRLTIQDQEGILSRIAVVPSHRSSGFGKKIVLELERIAKEKGVKKLSLTPHAYLEKFYFDLGYQKGEGQQTVGKYDLLNMTKFIGT
jgi:predicted GNAT family N-acyltransferase